MGESIRIGARAPDGRTGTLGELIHATIRQTIEVAAAGCSGRQDREGHRSGNRRARSKEWLANHGGGRMGMTQPEFAKFVQDENESAARLMRATGVMPQ
jgi:hypothetical protein